MPKFLNVDELYRVLQRELPEGVYPDGKPDRFYSTASIYSKAQLLANGYTNMSRIYANYFPADADEKIDDWVVKAFGSKFNDSVTLAEKQSRVIEKIRKQPRISLWEILTLVSGYIPEGKYVQILEYGKLDLHPWRLGVSLLGQNTFLYFVPAFDQVGVPALEFCEYVSNLHWRLGGDRLGVNTTLFGGDQQLITKAQLDAYAYEIRIFDYEVTGLDLQNMEKEIQAAQPARSGYILRQNLNLNDFGLTVPVTDVNEFDLVNCITRNALATTGYDGLTEAT